MSAQRRPRRLAATAGRGAARLACEVPNATGCPSAQRAAAENADTAIALRPGGVEPEPPPPMCPALLASAVRVISEQLPADLGVMSAAAGAAEALKLLLEVCTVRSMDDPRAAAVTANLARASDRLATAAEGNRRAVRRGPRRHHDHFPAGIAQNERAARRAHPPRNPDLTSALTSR